MVTMSSSGCYSGGGQVNAKGEWPGSALKAAGNKELILQLPPDNGAIGEQPEDESSEGQQRRR